MYFQLLHFKNSYLLDDFSKSDRQKYEIIGCDQPVSIDETDFKILQTIAPNARMPTVDISKTIGVSVETVNYRLKKLIKKGIIQGFRTEFNITKIGYKQFKVDIDFRDYKQIDAVTEHIISIPNLYYITKTAGHSDLEPTFRVKNIDQLHSIMNDIYSKFPNAIKNHKYFYILKMHKLHYMPSE